MPYGINARYVGSLCGDKASCGGGVMAVTRKRQTVGWGHLGGDGSEKGDAIFKNSGHGVYRRNSLDHSPLLSCGASTILLLTYQHQKQAAAGSSDVLSAAPSGMPSHLAHLPLRQVSLLWRFHVPSTGCWLAYSGAGITPRFLPTFFL